MLQRQCSTDIQGSAKSLKRHLLSLLPGGGIFHRQISLSSGPRSPLRQRTDQTVCILLVVQKVAFSLHRRAPVSSIISSASFREEKKRRIKKEKVPIALKSLPSVTVSLRRATSHGCEERSDPTQNKETKSLFLRDANA